MRTTYSEALNYLYNYDNTLSRAWSVVVVEFEDLPQGLRQALIDRLIELQKYKTGKETEAEKVNK